MGDNLTALLVAALHWRTKITVSRRYRILMLSDEHIGNSINNATCGWAIII